MSTIRFQEIKENKNICLTESEIKILNFLKEIKDNPFHYWQRCTSLTSSLLSLELNIPFWECHCACEELVLMNYLYRIYDEHDDIWYHLRSN